MQPPMAPPHFGYGNGQQQNSYYTNQGYNGPPPQGYPPNYDMGGGYPGGPPPQGYPPNYNMGGAPPQHPQGQGYYGGPPVPPMMPPRPNYGVDQNTQDDNPDGSPLGGKYALGFNSVSIRQGFIRKVFGIVCLQFLVVTLMVLAVFLIDEVRNFIRATTAGKILYYASYGVFIGTYLALACCQGIRRKSPLNIFLCALLTLAAGYMTAMITAYHDVQVVLIAVGVVTVVCGTIIIFATQTKFDFTSLLGIMFVVSMVVMVFGIVAVLVNMFLQIRYLAIDVQMVMGGKKHEISPEDYVFAAIQLFMDIIYIFWFLLQLIGECF